MNRISLFKTRIVIEDKVYLLAKDVRKAFGYKSIELLNPNMYRDMVLIDGDMDFDYSKTITKESFIEHK